MRKSATYFAIENSRRCSVLDLERILKGIDLYIARQRCNPNAIETEWISIVASGNTNKVVRPLTELLALLDIRLDAGFSERQSNSHLHTLVELVDFQLRADVVQRTRESKGDFTPLVIFILHGDPEDWEQFQNAIQIVASFRPNPVIFLAHSPNTSCSKSSHKCRLWQFCELNDSGSDSWASAFESMDYFRRIDEENRMWDDEEVFN